METPEENLSTALSSTQAQGWALAYWDEVSGLSLREKGGERKKSFCSKNNQWGRNRRGKSGYTENLGVLTGKASPVLPRLARRQWSGKLETVKLMFP